MTSFSVEPEALDQAGARFRADVSETQRSIADQRPSTGGSAGIRHGSSTSSTRTGARRLSFSDPRAS